MATRWLTPWGCLLLLTTAAAPANGQRRWDGEGGDSLWQNPRNWHPDGLPMAGDSVRLDQSLTPADYLVRLPAGQTTVILRSLQITPGPGGRITLLLPSANTAAPGLQLTDTGDCIRLDPGAVLRNASGAAAGEPLQPAGRLRIADGATYVHNTPRGNARIIDRLSQAPGTENGIFEFDVPGTAGYTVSLTGNTFGSLSFRATAAGNTKSYSGSGTSDLVIRGSLRIAAGARLTSTLTATIRLHGDLVADGLLHLAPATIGTTGRNLAFCGRRTQHLAGIGQITAGNAFRSLECRAATRLVLSRDVQLPLPGQAFLVMDSATLSLGTHAISGEGSFRTLPGATLDIGSPDGIYTTAARGNVRTRIRDFSPLANYHYTASGPQSTGDALPDSIRTLAVDKPRGHLSLAKPLRVYGRLILAKGLVLSRPETLLTLDGASLQSPGNAFGTSNAGWDSSFIDGPLAIRSGPTPHLDLPLGQDPVFAPARLLFPTARPTTRLTAEYRHEPYPTPTVPGPGGGLRTLEPGYWTLQPLPDTPTLQALLSLSWTYVGDSLAASTRKDSLLAVHASPSPGGTTWERVGHSHQTTGGPVSGWITPLQPPSHYGTFALAVGIPDASLPLTGIRLDASAVGTATRLRWTVEGSERQATFLIERSHDGSPFQAIARQPASDIRGGDAFSHTDPRPPPGWNLYRVTAHTDGAKPLASPIRQVRIADPVARHIFPNPAHRLIHIPGTYTASRGYAEVIDASGRRHMHYRLPPGPTGTLDVGHLPPGDYLLRIWTDGHAETYRFTRSGQAGR